MSLLEPWYKRSGATIDIGPTEIDRDQEYKVESIMAHRQGKGRRREYLVRWKGYSPAGDT